MWASKIFGSFVESISDFSDVVFLLPSGQNRPVDGPKPWSHMGAMNAHQFERCSVNGSDTPIRASQWAPNDIDLFDWLSSFSHLGKSQGVRMPGWTNVAVIVPKSGPRIAACLMIWVCSEDYVVIQTPACGKFLALTRRNSEHLDSVFLERHCIYCCE
jgi:hypothetical protein